MHQGFKQALRLYEDTAKHVQAYRTFLKNKKYSKRNVSGYKEWLEIPLMTKENYIKKYSLQQRIPTGYFPPMLYSSSGTTGEPTYWYGIDKQENLSRVSHEKMFRDMYGITRDEPTLLVVSFGMDVWISGHHTMVAGRDMWRLGYNFSVITPGYSEERTLAALRHLGSYYKNIIFAGHPPFVMDIVNAAKKKKLLSNKHRYRALVSGHKITEKWRDDLIEMLGMRNSLSTVSSVYGSTDAGKMAYETPLSIFVRCEAMQNKALHKELFHDARMPGLYQYHPSNIFFEEVNKELVISIDTGVPLVRYNMHDIGRVLPYAHVKKVLTNFGLLSKAKNIGLDRWKLPFVAVEGRSNVAATFYALHIYPEHLQVGIEHPRNRKYLSGTFFTYTKTINKSKAEQFHIILELSKNQVEPDRTTISKIQEVIVQELEKNNIEYRKLHEMIKKRALPILHFKEYNSVQFYPKNVEGVLQVKGRKPKVILAR